MRLFVTAVEADTDIFTFNRMSRTYLGDIAALDADGLALDQRFGYLLPGRLDDTSEGLAGHVHFFCRFSLVESLHIGKSHGLDLIDRKHDVLEFHGRNALWQKTGDFRETFH